MNGNEVVREGGSRPWALEVFDRSLKKRQKVELLREMAGPLREERCLLLTCGDNPGALNHHLRAAGGRWSWAEMEGDRIPGMEALLGDPVREASAERLPFEDASFDRVVVIDVHEHLPAGALGALNREIARVLVAGGVALLTTPSGDERLPLARVKRWVGMTPEVYGHQVQGYTWEQLEGMAREVGLVPEARGAYSRFFTEAIELAINVAYVKVLRKGLGPGEGGESSGGAAPPSGEGDHREGEIAPTSEEDLGRVGAAYRLYSAVYPLLRLISGLDRLIPGRGGYAVVVAARKPA